jgi:hypothetical protein
LITEHQGSSIPRLSTEQIQTIWTYLNELSRIERVSARVSSYPKNFGQYKSCGFAPMETISNKVWSTGGEDIPSLSLVFRVLWQWGFFGQKPQIHGGSAFASAKP